MIDAQATIAVLCEKFPKAFILYEQRRRPLKIGVRRDIEAALPTLTTKELGTALFCYTANRFLLQGRRLKRSLQCARRRSRPRGRCLKA
jgi:sRNA-binding protein